MSVSRDDTKMYELRGTEQLGVSFEDSGKGMIRVVLEMVQGKTVNNFCCNNFQVRNADISNSLADGSVQSLGISNCRFASFQKNGVGVFVSHKVIVNKRMVDAESRLEIAGFDSVQHDSVTQLDIELNSNLG